MFNQPKSETSRISRRQILSTGVAATSAAVLAGTDVDAAELPVVKNGRIKQSIVQWCFNARGGKWKTEKVCQVARQIGCESVELVGPNDFPLLKKYGLTCAIVSIQLPQGPPFVRGFNNPVFHDTVIHATRKSIDAAAAKGYPNVIAFTGYSAQDPDDPNSHHLTREEGARNCVDGFKKIIGHAEKQGVTLCLEMLNTRDGSDPMKGHPGYQGDNTEYCVDIIRQVGSPRLKLLFDIYHVQVMDGDVIRRIREHHDLIAHVHTAGNPGRGELNEDQEINYSAVMQALLDNGYDGYVGQEFIPTGDPLEGLIQAVRWCDV